MASDNFKIDFKKKVIFFNSEGRKKTFEAKELYSFLQDTFDEPENMKYEIPIVALSKDEFKLINGWTIDDFAKKLINGKIY